MLEVIPGAAFTLDTLLLDWLLEFSEHTLSLCLQEDGREDKISKDYSR